MTKIARRLLAEREAKGWNQIETARYIGVSQQTYSSWERAIAVPRRDHLPAVARFLGISAKDAIQLAYGSGKPTTGDRMSAMEDRLSSIEEQIERILSALPGVDP